MRSCDQNDRRSLNHWLNCSSVCVYSSVKVAAGQADGIQPRTIEVLQSYGLADRLLREGCQLHMAVSRRHLPLLSCRPNSIFIGTQAFYNPGPNGGIEVSGHARSTNGKLSSEGDYLPRLVSVQVAHLTSQPPPHAGPSRLRFTRAPSSQYSWNQCGVWVWR